MAEVDTSLKPLVPLQHIAHVPIATVVVDVVIRLHQSVLLNNPSHFWPHIRPDDSRGHLSVVVRRKLITHIVDQRRDNQLIVRAVAQRPGRSLQ